MVDVYRAHQQCANRDRLAFAGPGFPSSLERMTTVMAITCPHALGLAVPLVGTVSTSLAAGIVFAAEGRDVSPASSPSSKIYCTRVRRHGTKEVSCE